MTTTTVAQANQGSPVKQEHTGSRRALPADALKVCAECGAKRGTKRVGWISIIRDGEVVGYTCPECPTYDEPIRRMVGKTGRVSFTAVLRLPDKAGKMKQRRTTFSTLEQAREWVTQVRAAAKSGHAQPDGRGTVQQLAALWLAKREAEAAGTLGIREVTVSGYRSALSSPLSIIGARRVANLTKSDVERLLATLANEGGKAKRPLSHRSIVYSLGTLRQVFDYGIDEGWIKVNPAATAKVPKAQGRSVAKAPKAIWSASELIEFRAYVDQEQVGEAAARDPWVRAGMRLTLCGLRRSEVLGLTWAAVDLKAGTITVSASRVKVGAGGATDTGGAKTDHGYRTVAVDAIHPGTCGVLRELWLAQGRPASGALVIVDNLGQPVAPDTYSYRFRALSKAAGLPDLRSIHRVRHSLALLLHEGGVAPTEGASLLGHDVPTHLKFYLPTGDSAAARGAASVGAALAAVE